MLYILYYIYYLLYMLYIVVLYILFTIYAIYVVLHIFYLLYMLYVLYCTYYLLYMLYVLYYIYYLLYMLYIILYIYCLLYMLYILYYIYYQVLAVAFSISIYARSVSLIASGKNKDLHKHAQASGGLSTEIRALSSRELFPRENYTPNAVSTRHFNLVRALVTPFGEPINDNNSARLPFCIMVAPTFVLQRKSRPLSRDQSRLWRTCSFDIAAFFPFFSLNKKSSLSRKGLKI